MVGNSILLRQIACRLLKNIYVVQHFFGFISWRWNGKKKRAGWFFDGLPKQNPKLVYQLNTNKIFVTRD